MTLFDKLGSVAISALLAQYAYRILVGVEPTFFDHVTLWLFGTTAAIKLGLIVVELVTGQKIWNQRAK